MTSTISRAKAAKNSFSAVVIYPNKQQLENGHNIIFVINEIPGNLKQCWRWWSDRLPGHLSNQYKWTCFETTTVIKEAIIYHPGIVEKNDRKTEQMNLTSPSATSAFCGTFPSLTGLSSTNSKFVKSPLPSIIWWYSSLLRCEWSKHISKKIRDLM